MDFSNSYEDKTRAEAYSKLEFTKTYYLAYRDIPEIISKYVKGKKVIDFGCGTGRSTRFLKKLGLNPVGIDISDEMINIAKKTDPSGDYRLITNGDYNQFSSGSYDLILSAFTFDNISNEKKIDLFLGLVNLLNEDGIFINLVSSPEMYTNEWASFSTRDFPENKNAKSGDVVPIITIDIEDNRPCYDIYYSEGDYKKTYTQSGLYIVDKYKPLATGNEPFEWVNETRIAPWIIYVLKKK
jgi:trans-aconitate methyltransferase